MIKTRAIDDVKEKIAKVNGFPDWQALYNDLSHDQELLDFYIDQVAYCYAGQSNVWEPDLEGIPYKFPFRLGRKQHRALLDAEGKQIVIFNKGAEHAAEITVFLWNEWYKDLVKAWNELNKD